MPRNTRHTVTSSPSPDRAYPDEDSTFVDRIGSSKNAAVEKSHVAYGKAKGVSNQAWAIIRAYIPSGLLNRSAKDYYLLSYNTATLLMWSYLLLLLIAHLRTPLPTSSFFDPAPAATGTGETASETLGAYLKGLFGGIRGIRTTSTGFKVMQGKRLNAFEKAVNYVASFVDTLLDRSKVTYTSRGIGVYTLIIQSLALLEVAHSGLGLVRSPLQTTAMQVASRLLVVWWFVESEPSARTSAWYTSMVTAWTLSEILRSSYYIASLLELLPPRPDMYRATAVALNVLTYLRYTAFYMLYPLGAGSEWMIILKGFPVYPSKAGTVTGPAGWKLLRLGSGVGGWRVAFERFKAWISSFDAQAWARVPFVFIWPASLYVLMTYMHSQRRKALKRSPGRGMPAGRLRDVGGKAKRA